MSTKIRADISPKNPYWIDKHRYYELKHFCLQYNYWVKSRNEIDDGYLTARSYEEVGTFNDDDQTSRHALRRLYFSNRINLVHKAAESVDDYVRDYILKAVTNGLSYVNLSTKYDIPCGRDLYYLNYRRFFWTLNRLRQ